MFPLIFAVVASGAIYGFFALSKPKDELLENSSISSITLESNGLKEIKKEVAAYTGSIKKEITTLVGKPEQKGYEYLKKSPGFGNPTSTIIGDQIVRHTAYTLCYSNVHEQARWVAYTLTAADLKGKAKRDDEHFAPDPLVKFGSAESEDYKKSGFDRGHLAPAADMKRSEKVMKESFYMSNISPQRPEFNRGIWNKLEDKVRVWAKKEKEVFIVTGPVLKEKGFDAIGVGHNNLVAIPDAYYKVILDFTEPEIKMIGFLLKNEGSHQSLRTFVVKVDEIEKATGLDFFPQIPDELESKLELAVEPKLWFGKSEK